jgi:hypothetical protein
VEEGLAGVEYTWGLEYLRLVEVESTSCLNWLPCLSLILWCGMLPTLRDVIQATRPLSARKCASGAKLGASGVDLGVGVSESR